ncbi:alpha-hydroxy-acid oxidizing protein [Novosphingobium lubricantis]
MTRDRCAAPAGPWSNAVLVGCPILHALATSGALGVAHTLQVIRAELALEMALTGYQILKDCLFRQPSDSST